ncbi:hypothetical protein GDO86_016576 [Hymenochirus boettgeri]|uniref:Sorting nexin-33 n=1 Tax=Hymenochirus boettgeri TaxID=247094 RepID=A0A8T2K2F6_9PIPI|nr:hypothetical protein GDO86_016576 [Hymenochirus boettgeri]
MALKARALYSFQGENKEEIDILENEELKLFSGVSLDGWLQGTNSRGQTGLFPASYVEILRPHSGSSQVDYQGHSSSYTDAPQHGSYDDDEDDEDDDWDDWDDGQTVVDEPTGSNGVSHSPLQQHRNPRPEYTRRPRPHLEHQDSLASGKRVSVVGRNLNRFSSFVRSGVEAFVLGDVPHPARVAEKHDIEMGPKGPQWKTDPNPFSCSIEEPTKQTKFKGIKSYISYRLTPDHINSPVYRRYKHFDWLYNRLLHKFTVISVPHLPEKQATGRFEEDFILKRKRRLVLWMDHMTSHPVLSQYEGFQHFLSCRDEKQWKAGAFTKVKESQRMSDEGRMEQDESDGIRKRCRVVGFALQAEINHFHQRRLKDFKQTLQHYLKEQIVFYRRVSQELEKTLHMYDEL